MRYIPQLSFSSSRICKVSCEICRAGKGALTDWSVGWFRVPSSAYVRVQKAEREGADPEGEMETTDVLTEQIFAEKLKRSTCPLCLLIRVFMSMLIAAEFLSQEEEKLNRWFHSSYFRVTWLQFIQFSKLKPFQLFLRRFYSHFESCGL